MGFKVLESWFAVGLFVLILAAIECGRRLGTRHYLADPDRFGQGVSAAEGAVFGLLGLLLAFTFSGAASRFEDRRHLVTEEANAIGTAWLRLDMLSADAQPALRHLFKRYLDVRITTYAAIGDQTATRAKLADGTHLQAQIWNAAITAVKRPDAAPGSAQVVLPALNEMIDITTTRETATQNHPPLAIYLLLSLMCVAGGVMFGHSTGPVRQRSGLHILTFAGLMSLALYVIVDLEFPRRGLIRVDSIDHVLGELRASFDLPRTGEPSEAAPAGEPDARTAPQRQPIIRQ